MTGKAHMLLAGLGGTALAFHYDMEPIYIMTAVVGGMFPDTDQQDSLLGRWIPLWRICKPHRKNMTHSLIGMLLFSALVYWIQPQHGWFFAFGYATHLLLDACTKRGVCLWWPNKHGVTIMNVKSKGYGEFLTVFFFFGILMYILAKH